MAAGRKPSIVFLGDRAKTITNSRMPKAAAGSSLQAVNPPKNPHDAYLHRPDSGSSQILIAA